MNRRSCDFETHLTIEEVAALFRLPSRRAVLERVRRGTCPVPFRLGKAYLWERSEVIRFVEDNRVATSTQAEACASRADPLAHMAPTPPADSRTLPERTGTEPPGSEGRNRAADAVKGGGSQ
jgi:predicted DNA-binding transcriptional regulator AlpA